MQLSENQLFDGRYLLIELIGRGASAEVWKATDTKAGDMLVAVKIYKPDTLGPGSAGIAEFQREFTMVYNMTHTNLLHPQGFDIANGSPYLVMAFCENGSATSMVGRCDEEDILHFLRDVAAGLEYLHDHNITHQDIKPDNVLVDDNCNFMVTDFGISRRDAADSIGGTRAYMAPEVYKAKPEHASDIWSLGATAVELATGQPPYGELGGAAQTQNPAPINIKANLSAPVKKLITDMLDPDPRKRPSAATVRSLIDHYRETGSWNRNVQRNKIAYIATGIAALLLCVGLFFWDYNRTKVRYYKDYTEVWGVPQGVGKVSAFDQKHRQYTYKMEYKGGKLRHITRVNAHGNVVVPGETELQTKFTEAAYFYTNDGNVDYVKVYDQGGECVYVMDFDANLKTIIFKSDDEHGTEKPLKGKTTETALALTDFTPDASAITRYLVTYDDKGRFDKIEFATFQNVNVTDDDMIHGFIFKYDDRNRMIEKTSIGLDGQPRGNKRGLATKLYTYDDQDNWNSIKYLTVDGSPSSDGTNVPYFTHTHDKYGNILSEEYFNLEGEPMLRSDVNAAAYHYQLDDKGNTVKLEVYGTDGKKTTVAEGFSAIAFDYDDNGYVHSQTYLDINDSITNATLGGNMVVGRIVIDRNNRGLETGYTFFDRDIKPTETFEGNHKMEFTLDSVGHYTERRFYNKENKLNPINGYQAIIRSKYNNLGQQIEESYFDENDKPITCQDGYASVKYEYDLAGHMLKLTNYDINGKPVMHNNRYAVIEYEYDQRGNNTLMKLSDTKGDPVNCEAGWSKAEFIYDPATNYNTAVYRYNTAGTQVSGEEYKYDSRGNITESRYYAGKGQLQSNTAVEHSEYDSNNRKTREWYTDQSGNKVTHPANKYHEARYKYDTYGNLTESSFWSTTGQPVMSSSNVHKIVKEYNDRNQLVHWLNYDTSGNAVKETTENVAEAKFEYDTRGNQTVITLFDGKGTPINSSLRGYHKQVSVFDNRNKLTEMSFYDKDGKPAKDKISGYTKTTYEYDNHGNEVKTESYDMDKKMLTVTTTYNKRDKALSTVQKGPDGKAPDGQFYKFVFEYEDDDVTPKKLSAYTDEKTLVAYCIWDKKKEAWGEPHFTGAGQSAPSYSYAPTSYGSSWQDEFRDLARQCPMVIDNDVDLISISVSSSSVSMTFKLKNISKYEANADDIRTAQNYLRQEFNSLVPSNVSVYITLLDKAGRSF